MKTAIKIGFVLLSRAQSPIPSTRIAVLNMLSFLRAANFDAHIVFEPPQSNESPDVSGLAQKLSAEQFDIVFFQKVRGASVISLANELRVAGIQTRFGVVGSARAPIALNGARDRTRRPPRAWHGCRQPGNCSAHAQKNDLKP